MPSRRYGGQTLLVDVTALTLVGIGFLAVDVTSGHEPKVPGLAAMVLGGAVYLFGSPIVHGLHGNGGRATGSLGMRIGFPLLGAAIGAALSAAARGKLAPSRLPLRWELAEPWGSFRRSLSMQSFSRLNLRLRIPGRPRLSSGSCRCVARWVMASR